MKKWTRFLSDTEREQMLSLRAQGKTFVEIAKETGRAVTTVMRACQGVSRKKKTASTVPHVYTEVPLLQPQSRNMSDKVAVIIASPKNVSEILGGLWK